MLTAPTPANIDLICIITLVVYGLVHCNRFFRGSRTFEKTGDFCLTAILWLIAAWIWFNHRTVVITTDGIVYKGVPEKIFLYCMIASVAFLLISKFMTRPKKEKPAKN